MISNIQNALDKANEMMAFYSQYLPIDFFAHELDEDMDQESDQLTLRGLFRHLKNTFDDTKQTLKRELATGTNYSESSSQDEIEEEENDENQDINSRHHDDLSDQSPSQATHSQSSLQNLHFKSAEKVHDFLMEVIQNLVQNRGQLAQLFKDMQ